MEAWFSWMTRPDAWIGLLTLTVLEIVLGIDNIVFISILSGKLPREQQPSGRKVGLLLAMLTRIGLLFSLAYIIHLTAPWFSIFGHGVSGRDLILLGGGLFLIAKSTYEIHNRLEGEETHETGGRKPVSFMHVVIEIMLLDIVFSLDSVITAVGMVGDLPVMVLAIVVAVGIMMVFSEPVSRFIDAHPTVKMLALSFLLLIGLTLMADGLGTHVPKGYVYFAMAFSVFVELLNLRVRKKMGKPVQLRGAPSQPDESGAQTHRGLP
jgi:predicted tellurium resistance membrane protein TerC